MLQWTEKYRPNNLDDIISHSNNIFIIKKILENNSLPHLLFYGSPGTGKTTSILSIINQIYGPKSKTMVMKLDASDDRGINTVRDEIKGFADKINLFNNNIQIIVLDEVDSMTYDAQFALRRIIEKYSNTIRFCLICNYDNKIIFAIKTRCVNFRFNYINNTDISNRLKKILTEENINIKDEIIDTISYISKGDLRKAVNILQTIVSFSNENITCKYCHSLYGIPYIDDIAVIYNVLLDNNKSIQIKYNTIKQICYSNNYLLVHLITELYSYSLRINTDMTGEFIMKLSNLEIMIYKSINTDLYIYGLISIYNLF